MPRPARQEEEEEGGARERDRVAASSCAFVVVCLLSPPDAVVTQCASWRSTGAALVVVVVVVDSVRSQRSSSPSVRPRRRVLVLPRCACRAPVAAAGDRYYHDLGSLIEDDVYFEWMIRAAWKVGRRARNET